MTDTPDKPNVVIHPPIAWALAIAIGVGANWLVPLRFVPPPIPHIWIGAALIAAGFALAMSAVLTLRAAGTRVETYKPTTTITANGPYRFSRNPIYIGIFLVQTGIAFGFDNLWHLITLVPLYFTLRHGVITREEAYLARKFGPAYHTYKSRVRRWF